MRAHAPRVPSTCGWDPAPLSPTRRRRPLLPDDHRLSAGHIREWFLGPRYTEHLYEKSLLRRVVQPWVDRAAFMLHVFQRWAPCNGIPIRWSIVWTMVDASLTPFHLVLFTVHVL